MITLHQAAAQSHFDDMNAFDQSHERNPLPEIIAEESIITSDGKRLIKIPIRSLEEYRFRFDPNQGERVGQGNGESKVVDVLGQARPGGQPGQEKQAGDAPGVDYYEAEVTVDDLAAQGHIPGRRGGHHQTHHCLPDRPGAADPPRH
jgi:uncharacterized sporulation protein YeaH/YhbH (DUF444 family)